jgi:tRNA(Ile)-lysidine synthase
MQPRALSAALRRQGLSGGRLVVAVSGGLDSVCLLHALCEMRERERLGLVVGHIQHGLRGKESEADAVFVAELAAEWGIPAQVRSADPRPLSEGGSSRARPTLQEAARQLRYRALREIAAEQGARIATAHTADDQAETLVLRLLRGTGPDGLRGIRERSDDGVVVRPLLRVTRAELECYAAERGLRWREDSSNAMDDYTRNRLRHHWLPELAREFNPRLASALAGLAEAQEQDAQWIATEVEREMAQRVTREGAWLRIDAAGICALPPALARRVAREVLSRCGIGREVTRVHLERVLAFWSCAQPERRLELPLGRCSLRSRDGFRVGPVPDPNSETRAPAGIPRGVAC